MRIGGRSMAKKKAKRQSLSQDRQIRLLKPETAGVYEHSITGTQGLRIRVNPNGRKDWFYRYKVRSGEKKGKLQKIKLGVYRPSGGMSLADARDEYERYRQLAAKHGDIKDFLDGERKKREAEHDAKDNAAAHAAFTVEAMVEQYLDDVSRRLKSWRQIGRGLRQHVIPVIGHLPAGDVKRSDVFSVLTKLHEREKYVYANRILAYLSGAYSWAILTVKEAEDFANPCSLIKRKKEFAKRRALPDVEIRRYFSNLPKADIGPDCADGLEIILLSALRPGEVVALKSSDIDTEARTITIQQTKSGEPHTVYASRQLMKILKRRMKGSVDWLFPAKTNPKKYMRTNDLSEPLRNSIQQLKIMATTPHDYRRSCATGLERIGAPRMVIAKALNHSDTPVTGVYARYSYEAELRDWLQRWADHVDELRPKQRKKAAKAA